jgi:hypothetical protein
MILESLVSQIEQRFLHEKRARVCLWFDEKGEFLRLLPALQAHLASAAVAPFVLLTYDAASCRGQVWLKTQVSRRLAEAEPGARKKLRFVLYVPVPEERLDVPDDAGARLDLLEEYRTAGVLFRIGGKRPTLFAFLRQAGLVLPAEPADQRRLWDGGRDSLLAKYVAKFVDRPPTFWTKQLTPELAQANLIGDMDQTILDVAVDPDGTWAVLTEKGLLGEFVEMVRERYGFEVAGRSPGEWIESLVAQLALTETFLGYREPADFPFLDRLPPLALRPHHVQLLQRWLRDTEYRTAWDRWIGEVETKIDLNAWAAGRTGFAFGFPHLSFLRMREANDEFELSSAKDSTTAAYFAKRREAIAKEAEFAKASETPLRAWAVLRDLDAFLGACTAARTRVDAGKSARDFAQVYVANAAAVDGQHVALRYAAEEQGLPAVARVADRAYAAYANALNTAFFQCLADAGSAEVAEIPGVSARLDQAVWKAKGRRAVVIVDALRYDCALALGALLRGTKVEVEPVLATLPTVTAVGMTALLPLGGATVTLEAKGNGLHLKVAGKDMAVRENRIAVLREFGAECRDIADVEGLSEVPADAGELLVVFGHDEVDKIGHSQADNLVRHVHLEIERLARLVRKLHRWSYGQVHVVTDHGFVLLDESKLPSEVPCQKDWCHVLKERFALVPASADLSLVRFPFAWDADVRVAVPPGLAFFKAEKSFSHGGASVQELVIPHLVSRAHAAEAKRVGVEVVLPEFELQRPGAKVILRPVSAAGGKTEQMQLFSESGRALSLNVLRRATDGTALSVLPTRAPKPVKLEARGPEQIVTLFFHSAERFAKGELLELDIRDVETSEQFPPGGIKLTVGRDM